MLEFKDNRVKGLLNEIMEALRECDDPHQLRRFGKALKSLSSEARGRAWEIKQGRGEDWTW